MATNYIDLGQFTDEDGNIDYKAIYMDMENRIKQKYTGEYKTSGKCKEFYSLVNTMTTDPSVSWGSCEAYLLKIVGENDYSFVLGVNPGQELSDYSGKHFTFFDSVYLVNSTPQVSAGNTKIQIYLYSLNFKQYDVSGIKYTEIEDTIEVTLRTSWHERIYYYKLPSGVGNLDTSYFIGPYVPINKYMVNGKPNWDRSNTAIIKWNSNTRAYYDYVVSFYEKNIGEVVNPVYESWSKQEMLALDNNEYNYIEPYGWFLTPLPVIDTRTDGTSNADITIIENLDNEWNVDPIQYPIDTKTNWKVYIDGTKLPNYKIVWHNEEIENKKTTDNARIKIQYAEVDPEYPVELRVPELIHETNYAEYNDGNYKTNFKTLYEGAWGEVYNEGIMSTLPKQSVWLLLQLDYYSNGITTVLPTETSTKMAVLLNPSGSNLYSYADIWNTSGESDGSTIEVITDKGSGEGDDGYKDGEDSKEEDITDGASNSVGVLTTTYAMTIERLNQLGGFLWGANIFDEFSLVNSNPIENIISCKNIPISLSGTDEIIHLGNVDTGTNGAKVASNFSTLNVGQIALPTKYNSFLDFAPYTKVTIYLPYIGFKEIDATIAIGKMLKVAYVADVITGGCIAQIFINGVRFYEFSGEMGVDIPITASNRAQVEASYISNAVGMGASLASGNITGAVDSVLASATAKYNYSSTDTPNANCVASVNRTCYVIIERPTYQELSQFNHTKGKMCNLSKTIGSLKGFTICDANIDLKGITATEQEKQEISSILSSGFFA